MKHLFTFLLILYTCCLSAQPTNDMCMDAEAIGEVMGKSFVTTDATTDGPYHENSPCPSNSEEGQDSIYNDVWYAYTAGLTGLVEWTLCGTADFDTKIAVYNAGATCPLTDADLLDCNEDFGTCANATSALLFNVVEGETYLLRLGGYGMVSPGEEGIGTFSIGEFIPAVANDFCDSAIEVTEGAGQEFTIVDASTDGPDHPGDGTCFGFNFVTASNDIWYTFTPTFTGSANWSTCDMISFDSRLVVYNAGATCPVTQADMLACNDDGAGCSNFTSNLFFDVVAGETYLLRLGSFGDEFGSGTFDLLNSEPPEPPSNDLCADALIAPVNEIGSNEVVQGTTVAATFDPNTFVFPSCLGNVSGGEFAEVWYQFNSGENTEITMDFGIETPGSLFFVDLFEDCSTAVDTLNIENSCFFYDGSNGVGIFTDTLGIFPGVPTNYYMRVVTRVTTDLPGDFFIILTGNNVVNDVYDIDGIEEINFFPNPLSRNDGSLSIRSSTKKDLKVDITNMMGQVVVKDKIVTVNPGSNEIPIEIDNQPGIYMMNIRHEAKSKSIKIIKI